MGPFKYPEESHTAPQVKMREDEDAAETWPGTDLAARGSRRPSAALSRSEEGRCSRVAPTTRVEEELATDTWYFGGQG